MHCRLARAFSSVNSNNVFTVVRMSSKFSKFINEIENRCLRRSEMTMIDTEYTPGLMCFVCF